MRKLLAMMMVLSVAGSAMAVVAIPTASEWHAWGVHGGSVTVSANGTITSNVGTDATYHWNKSNWATRIGQKAFVSTSDFNGMTVGQALASISYNVTGGYYGDMYFNIMVEDSNGKKAIIAPTRNSATSSGFATDGSANSGNDFSIFEAEAGWTGTSATGWYAAEFSDVMNLVITDGPFTEFPDTLNGDAIAQDDATYSAANWAAWADASAGYDCGWEQDGFLLVFGQSTGGNSVVAENVMVNGVTVVPEPATLAILGLGGLLLRRKK